MGDVGEKLKAEIGKAEIGRERLQTAGEKHEKG